MPSVIRAVLAVSCVALFASGCGYALAGRGNALPTTIHVIGVPQFVNHSTTPDIDGVLTNAVRTELQGKGRFRIDPEVSAADAVLTGTVISVVATPVAFTSQNLASSYNIVVTASVEFRDVKADKVIWANPSFQVSDQYDVSGTTNATPVDPTAIFRQDNNALDRLSRRFSRSVVTSIFEAF